MSTAWITRNITERLLMIAIISLITVYCVYWATRSETNFSLAAVAVKQLRPVDEDYRAPCGFDTFRAVAQQRTDGYITGSGTWTRNGTHIKRFHPSVCRLTHGKWIPEDELAMCLQRHRIQYIAIIGDSNGRGYLLNLHRLLSSRRRRIVCGPIIRYTALRYNSYRLPQVYVKHRCPCGGYCTLEFSKSMRFVHCDVLQALCTLNNVTDVALEYITSWFTIDNKVQVPYINADSTVICYGYNTVWSGLFSHFNNSQLSSVVTNLFHDRCPSARQ